MHLRILLPALFFTPVLVRAQNRNSPQQHLDLANILVTILPIVLVFFLIYFFVIRNQRKQKTQTDQYLDRNQQHMDRIERSLERIAIALENGTNDRN